MYTKEKQQILNFNINIQQQQQQQGPNSQHRQTGSKSIIKETLEHRIAWVLLVCAVNRLAI
jgi:hypothetical protein